MSVQELRSVLAGFIAFEADEALLQEIYEVLQQHTSKEKLELNEAEKIAVDNALEQYENGEYSSHEEVMARMKQRFPHLYK